MNSIFSVDDFSELLWPAPVSDMGRSASEWELEKFLEDLPAPSSFSGSNNEVAVSESLTSSKPNRKGEDDVVEIQKPDIHRQPLDRNPLPARSHLDAEEYHAFLKSQLDLACAAAVKSRDSNAEVEGVSSSIAKDQILINGSCQSGSSPVSGNKHGISKGQNEADSGLVHLPASPSLPKKQEVPVRQTTSGSSREDSDDDEDTETNDNMDPADEKRARRMQSNRESARRSRRRKQAQLNELEAQVGQLRDERTSLLTRLTDINKKCDDASVDNRILNANIETLRTKVKMAEDQVKRVTGLNPLALARSNMPSMGMQFVGGQTNAPVNVGVPGQPNNSHFFHHSVSDISSAASHLHRVNSGCPNNNLPHATTLPVDNRTSNIAGLASLQQLTGKSSTNVTPITLPMNNNRTSNAGGLASLHPLTTAKTTANSSTLPHVQKQTGPTVGSPASLPACNGSSQPVTKDNKKK